jgi:alkaline phosphatase D
MLSKTMLFISLLVMVVGGTAFAQDAAPQVTHGPISGEVTENSAVLWARGNQTGELVFELFQAPDFAGESFGAAVDVDESTDFTGQAAIDGLTPDTTYYYRIALKVNDTFSDWIEGQFKTAPASDSPGAVRFAFSACVGGQGYCRNPETGWPIFDTILAQEPDFFLLTGDSVYVDSACPSDEGQNVPGAEEVATDLAGFRARYRYHLEDSVYSNFLAQTPVYVTWDDHEIVDNFSGQTLRGINPQLFEDGRQAYFEYWPLLGDKDDPYRMYRSVSYGANADFFILDTRSYRDPLVNWDTNPNTGAPKSMLGMEQFAWLQEALNQSDATWKFIVSSVPLSYPTGWPQPQVDGRDGWANNGEPSGYESELMALLYYIETHDIENVVFLVGDTHWPFALSYDPDRDGVVDFYEFGSSPLSALTLPPVSPDQTFNPTVLYEEGEFAGTLWNFSAIEIDESGDLTLQVFDWEGTERFLLTLTPQ